LEPRGRLGRLTRNRPATVALPRAARRTAGRPSATVASWGSRSLVC